MWRFEFFQPHTNLQVRPKTRRHQPAPLIRIMVTIGAWFSLGLDCTGKVTRVVFSYTSATYFENNRNIRRISLAYSMANPKHFQA